MTSARRAGTSFGAPRDTATGGPPWRLCVAGLTVTLVAAAALGTPSLGLASSPGRDLRPSAQPGCAETLTLLAGRRDEFATTDGVEAPVPDPTSWAQYGTSAAAKNFDELAQGVVFHTFTALTATGEICAASLEFRAAPNPADALVGNDNVRFFFGDGIQAWIGYFGTGNPGPALRASPWGSGSASAETFTVDLSALPLAGGSTLDLVPELNRVGLLDVNLSDDSAFDYAELRLWALPEVPTPTATATKTSIPSATPSQTPSATPTASPSASPAPSPTLPAQLPSCVCEPTRRRVPTVAIVHAIVNPFLYHGWGYTLDPGKPPGPSNPLRECLNLSNPGSPYHPLFNALEWRVGCR